MGFLKSRKVAGKPSPSDHGGRTVADVSDDQLDQLLRETSQPVVVDFWASWCAPCKLVKPALESLARSYEGRAAVVKVNVDENTRWTAKLGIRGIPTIAFFLNGTVVNQLIGVRGEKELRRTLDHLLDADVTAATE